VPFGDGTVSTYLDTSTGNLVLELGALTDPEVTVTTDYETARRLFVDFDSQAAMQAFMAGKVKVQGDMMKLLALQGSVPTDGVAREVAVQIQQLTA
jgi:putative sterol carrier protein